MQLYLNIYFFLISLISAALMSFENENLAKLWKRFLRKVLRSKSTWKFWFLGITIFCALIIRDRASTLVHSFDHLQVLPLYGENLDTPPSNMSSLSNNKSQVFSLLIIIIIIFNVFIPRLHGLYVFFINGFKNPIL